MSKAKDAAPLIKRPVEEILATARAAGRNAFVTKAVVEAHWDAVSLAWIDETMPNSLGVMDDDAFGNLMEKVATAFGEGVDDYLNDCTVVATLKREKLDLLFEIQCAAEQFDWLAGIFDAIMKSATPHSNVMRMAQLGSYLATDRHEVLYVPDDSPGDSNG